MSIKKIKISSQLNNHNKLLNLYVDICNCRKQAIEDVHTHEEIVDAIGRVLYYKNWFLFDFIVLDFSKEDIQLRNS